MAATGERTIRGDEPRYIRLHARDNVAIVANDFGRKNLYHNLGVVNGRVRFKDVARDAGVEEVFPPRLP